MNMKSQTGRTLLATNICESINKPKLAPAPMVQVPKKQRKSSTSQSKLTRNMSSHLQAKGGSFVVTSSLNTLKNEKIPHLTTIRQLSLKQGQSL